MPVNTIAVFITNSPLDLTGSSLYVILPNGTIRFSGANDFERTATTFIRPFLVGYCSYLRKGIMYQRPMQGLFPFEAEVAEHIDLGKLFIEDKKGHKGNCITEVIRFQELYDLSFCPKTWRGREYGGTEWNIALAEVLKAILHVTQKKSFARTDIELVKEPEETKYSMRMFSS